MQQNNSFDGFNHQSSNQSNHLDNISNNIVSNSTSNFADRPSENFVPEESQVNTNFEQVVFEEEDVLQNSSEGFTLGKVAYFGLLSFLLVALVGLPIWVLLNQEDRAEIAGISEEKKVVLQDNSKQLDTIDESLEEEVYIYNPETQTFSKTNGSSDTKTVVQGGGSVNLNPASPVDGTNFAEAFAQARSQLGQGAVFEWNGQLYSTDYRSNEPAGIQEQYPSNIYSSLSAGQKLVSDNSSKVLEINECNLNIKYPIFTENGAMVDFDRENAKGGNTPYWTFYAFTGYQSEYEKFGLGYTLFVQCFNLVDLGEQYSIGDQKSESVDPEELFNKTGWMIADKSISNLRMSRNENLVQGYSVTFTRGGQMYSLNFMSKPKDSNDTIGGLYAYQVQLQFQDQIT